MIKYLVKVRFSVIFCHINFIFCQYYTVRLGHGTASQYILVNQEKEKEIYNGLLDRQKCNYLAKVWVLKEAFVKARRHPIVGMKEARMFSYISPNLVPSKEVEEKLKGVNIHCLIHDEVVP